MVLIKLKMGTKISKFVIILNQDSSLFSRISLVLFVFSGFLAPFTLVRPVLGLSISDLLLLIAVFFAIIDLLVYKRKTRTPRIILPFIIPSLFIILGGVISSLSSISVDPVNNSYETIQLIFVYVFVPIGITQVINDRKRLDILLNALILGVFVSSITSIVDKYFDLSFWSFISPTPSKMIGYEGAKRFGGVTNHANLQGFFLAVLIPLIISNIIRYRYHRVRILINLFFLFVCLWGLFLTGSISAQLSLIFGIILLCFVWLFSIFNKSNVRGLFVGMSLILISTLIFLISFIALNASRSDLNNAKEILDIELSDYPNIERVVTKTSMSRMIGYKFVLNEMVEHPFLGFGYDISQQRGELPVNESGNPIGIHNVFLLFFLGGGMFGVIGSVLIYLKAVLTAISAMRIWSHEYSDSLLLMLSVAVMNFIFIDFVQPHMHIRISWLLFSLLYIWVLEFRSEIKFGKTSNYTQGSSWM